MRPAEVTFEDVTHDLRALLRALGPYRSNIVLAGGWAPWLYRHLPQAGIPEHPALGTRDFDLQKLLALPRRRAAKRNKDRAYLFDVALVTRPL